MQTLPDYNEAIRAQPRISAVTESLAQQVAQLTAARDYWKERALNPTGALVEDMKGAA